jgi:hypothetical protein
MEGVKTGIGEVLGTQYLLNTPMGFHAIPRIPINKYTPSNPTVCKKVIIFHNIYMPV